MKKILITGGAGLVGTILSNGLKERFSVRILDQNPVEGFESFVGDISDLNSILPAFKNVESVVHLAADRRVHGDWESILKNNISGTYNIYEASRLNNIKRVVFASSQHATGGFYDIPPWSFIAKGEYKKVPSNYSSINETTRIRPDSFYGVSKSFGESLGSYYSDFFGLSTIHLRIGWIISDDDPTFSAISLTLWLSHKDVCQIIEKCINATTKIKYDVFYATSDNYWKIWSIEKAKKILGYTPQDSAGKNFEIRKPKKADT